ncbi:MAG: aminotransferase class V-fold PLP-dependent enzyme [Actinomycetota bacterium]
MTAHSLAAGRTMVAIPGPSVIPDSVLQAFSEPMPDLYEGPIVEIENEVRSQLPSIARTSGEAFTVIGNGHAAWQMATSNTLARGDKVLVLEAGRFATVWGTYTSISDIEVDVLEGDDRTPVDPDQVEARLREDAAHEIRAILVAHVDTASSVRNDIPAIRQAIDAAGHPALFMVDCIASMGCEEFLMDEWGVDIAVAGCQKGLMVPPGVSFVWVSEKAAAAHERADSRVGYFDWVSRRDLSNLYSYYSGTPPIAHLRGLKAAFDLIHDEGGLDAVWARHAVLADAVKAAVSAWSAPGGVEFQITSEPHRSNCVTTVRIADRDPAPLRAMAEAGAGLVVGLGIAGIPGFRIAHMGHLNPPMILGTLATIESVLIAGDVPIGGSGIEAATAVVGKHLAGGDFAAG